MTWKAETFDVATTLGAEKVSGHTYRGLGLWVLIKASPKGRRPERWSLTHLNTGHRIAFLVGNPAVVMPVAGEIADAGDWDFLSMEGWKDRFPDALERLQGICERYPKIATIAGGGSSNRELAMQIAAART